MRIAGFEFVRMYHKEGSADLGGCILFLIIALRMIATMTANIRLGPSRSGLSVMRIMMFGIRMRGAIVKIIPINAHFTEDCPIFLA